MILPSLCWTSLSVYTNLCDLSSLLSPLFSLLSPQSSYNSELVVVVVVGTQVCATLTADLIELEIICIYLEWRNTAPSVI